jgi:hypothetical protein
MSTALNVIGICVLVLMAIWVYRSYKQNEKKLSLEEKELIDEVNENWENFYQPQMGC